MVGMGDQRIGWMVKRDEEVANERVKSNNTAASAQPSEAELAEGGPRLTAPST